MKKSCSPEAWMGIARPERKQIVFGEKERQIHETHSLTHSLNLGAQVKKGNPRCVVAKLEANWLCEYVRFFYS